MLVSIPSHVTPCFVDYQFVDLALISVRHYWCLSFGFLDMCVLYSSADEMLMGKMVYQSR
jgi:hypothetical protein